MILNIYDTWPQKNSPSPFSWAASTPPRRREQHYSFSIRHQDTAGRPPPIDQSPCIHQTMPVQQPSNSRGAHNSDPADPAESTYVVLTIATQPTQPSQLTWCSLALDLRHPISRPPPCIHAVYGFEIQKTNDSTLKGC